MRIRKYVLYLFFLLCENQVIMRKRKKEKETQGTLESKLLPIIHRTASPPFLSAWRSCSWSFRISDCLSPFPQEALPVIVRFANMFFFLSVSLF